MIHIDKQTLILSSLCHLIASVRRMNNRLDDIESRIDEVAEAVCEDDVDEYPIDDADDEAISDQLLDAADEIEDRGYVPQNEAVAKELRDIAEMLRNAANEAR